MNLVWNTSRLNVDGSLWVVSTAAPVILQTRMVGGWLTFSGSGGTPNWSYYVLGATNLTTPLAQWTCLATNQFDGAGNFNFTDSFDGKAAPHFYLLRLP